MSDNSPRKLDEGKPESSDEILKPFTDSNDPKYPIGQIVFDINGEYANPNLQDEGTAIFDIYKERTIRYSTVKKEGFREMKVNFFKEIENGFDLIRSHPNIATDDTRFVSNFRTVTLENLRTMIRTRARPPVTIVRWLLIYAVFIGRDSLFQRDSK